MSDKIMKKKRMILNENGTNHKKRFKEKQIFSPIVKHIEGEKWHNYQTNEKAITQKDTFTGEEYQKLYEEALVLLSKDNDLYSRSSKSQGGSEAAWLMNVVKKGTAADKLTAMQLQIQSSPVHSLAYAESMVTHLAKKLQRESLEIIPILEEAFIHQYLPPRKLISFSARPLAKLDKFSNNATSRARVLILWVFEDQLKEMYARFIKILEILASGQVLDLAKKAIRTSANLLMERPEGEQTLLTLIVNKLGHPKKSVGAFVAHMLESLARKQPRMKFVLVKEVEKIVYRKNINPKAQIYAATFLSQMEFKKSDGALALFLMKIYFGLFKTIVSAKKGASTEKELGNRLLAILLAGANRALPYAKESAVLLEDDVNALYRVVNTSSYSVALNTLRLLQKIQSMSESLADRYYSALFRKLEEPVPVGCYNQLMLLLFKTLKTDQVENRVRTFVKRLFQMATAAPPPLTAGILILISKVAEERRDLVITVRDADRALKMTNLHTDDDEECYVDYDVDGKPVVKTEAKTEDYETLASDDDDDTKDEKKPLKGNLSPFVKKGWLHNSGKSSRQIYDKTARNPMFIDCSNVADAELLLLSKHYHPSIAVFAQQMLEGKPLKYRGDPLEDFTMMKFLDRFAYRNPKENKITTSSDKVIKKKAYDPWGVRALKVTSTEYLAKNASELPPDERYLHRYAKLKFKEENNEKKENEDDWEISSVNSDEFDAILERFEPGEANEIFDDIDFSKEFTSEKKKKQTTKEKDESDGEDDELSDYGDMDGMEEDEDAEMAEDDEEEDEDDEEKDEDDDYDGLFLDDDEEGEERAFSRNVANGSHFSDDDEDMDNIDAAGDEFEAMLEDMEDEDKKKSKNQHKRKTSRSKKFGKRR